MQQEFQRISITTAALAIVLVGMLSDGKPDSGKFAWSESVCGKMNYVANCETED